MTLWQIILMGHHVIFLFLFNCFRACQWTGLWRNAFDCSEFLVFSFVSFNHLSIKRVESLPVRYHIKCQECRHQTSLSVKIDNFLLCLRTCLRWLISIVCVLMTVDVECRVKKNILRRSCHLVVILFYSF